VRADGSNWLTAEGTKKRPFIDTGRSIADRLKRAAQLSHEVSKEIGGFED
jgi:hypothetical protein